MRQQQTMVGSFPGREAELVQSFFEHFEENRIVLYFSLGILTKIISTCHERLKFLRFFLGENEGI